MRTRWRLALLGIVAVVTVGLLRANDSDTWIAVGDLNDVRASGVVYLVAERVFVVASDESFLALSADAPHIEGERVLYCPSSGWFEGQHGEMFDPRGYYALGPAHAGLTRLTVRVTDGEVEVNPEAVLAVPPRGENRPQPPTGPFCNSEGTPPIEQTPGFTS